ncbi:MAG: tyrosinase family protein [Crocinitomicaceae bacterium]
MKVRKNLFSLSKEEFQQFVQGVYQLKNEKIRANMDGQTVNTYNYYVDIHARSVKVPANGPQYDVPQAHQGPTFLPWHRKFLLMFEKDMRRVLQDEEFCLPYWDWTEDSALSDPKASKIWTEDFVGFNGNVHDQIVTSGPFGTTPYQNFPAWQTYLINDDNTKKHGSLHRDLGGAGNSLPTSTSVQDCLKMDVYDTSPWNRNSSNSFRNTLEGFKPLGLHNAVHMWIGGAMKSVSTAVNDPIFWLHHCNIDRIWAKWQEKHPNSDYLPSTGASDYQNKEDHLWKIGIQGQNELNLIDGTKNSDFLSIKDLDYTYADGPSLLMISESPSYGKSFLTRIGDVFDPILEEYKSNSALQDWTFEPIPGKEDTFYITLVSNDKYYLCCSSAQTPIFLSQITPNYSYEWKKLKVSSNEFKLMIQSPHNNTYFYLTCKGSYDKITLESIDYGTKSNWKITKVQTR